MRTFNAGLRYRPHFLVLPRTPPLVAQGTKPAELIESYPRLTAEMIWLAPIYATAHPLRGPSCKMPWRDQLSVRRRRCISAP